MKVLHVNFDVSRYWPYWQGGVPAVIGNIIRYTAGPDLSYRYLTADYRYTSYQQEGNVHILETLLVEIFPESAQYAAPPKGHRYHSLSSSRPVQDGPVFQTI